LAHTAEGFVSGHRYTPKPRGPAIVHWFGKAAVVGTLAVTGCTDSEPDREPERTDSSFQPGVSPWDGSFAPGADSSGYPDTAFAPGADASGADDGDAFAPGADASGADDDG
jgi:hypothetical protein